jgi:hypothetical protein
MLYPAMAGDCGHHLPEICYSMSANPDNTTSRWVTGSVFTWFDEEVNAPSWEGDAASVLGQRLALLRSSGQNSQ